MKKIIYSIICIVIIGLISLLFILDLNKSDTKKDMQNAVKFLLSNSGVYNRISKSL